VDGVTATSYVDDERTVKVTMATSSPHVWPAPQSLPPEPDTRAARIEIQQAVNDVRRRIVVLDDDPTGVQTMHDIEVLTTWEVPELTAELSRPAPLFYVLTNSRALDWDRAVALGHALARNIRAAGEQARVRVDVISRSDSTLRGHYPWELDPLTSLFDADGPDGHVIVPAYPDGGRVTVNGVHYVTIGDTLVPAAETDFAHDPSFGYTQSSLADWVEEKSAGRWTASDVLHIPLALLRAGDITAVVEMLLEARHNQPIVADCAGDADLVVLIVAILRAEAHGRRYLYRTAASFVKVRAGLGERPLLTRNDLGLTPSPSAGLVLVGSYVTRTAQQLVHLLRQPGVVAHELAVEPLLAPGADAIVREAALWADRALEAGHVAVVYTSRDLVNRYGNHSHVHVAASISRAVSDVAATVARRPTWIVAKGGITASDVATRGLGVRRARVLGQIARGAPVWQLGPEARFPRLPYIVFPGNVGTDETLAEVVALRAVAHPSRPRSPGENRCSYHFMTSLRPLTRRGTRLARSIPITSRSAWQS